MIPDFIKRNLVMFTLLFIGSVLTSCEKSNLEYENQYDKSYKSWLNFKKSTGNSYRYMVTGGTWVGYSWQTVITVTEGKITQRHFKYTSSKELPEHIPLDALEWTEDENQINSHTYTSAAEALTLDEIYTKAKADWLLKRKEAKTYFEAKNRDMISACGYVENGCQDDCFRGINIGFIEAL